MSAFLGPIHHWMYDKIKRQETLTQKILEASKINHWLDDLSIKVDESIGTFVFGDLEECIDASNIHGWLSSQVELAESRYAFVVTELIKINLLQQILEIHFEDGKTAGSNLDVNSSCEEIFHHMKDCLLDGMPCAGGIKILTEAADEIVWMVDENVHKPYWINQEYDISLYFQLRDAWLKGFVSEKNIRYTKLNDVTFRLQEIEE